MPIRKSEQGRYPPKKIWAGIRVSILERAGNCCEGTDRFPDCRASNGNPHPESGSKVVLTIAHLDHTPENNDPANLRALCQRCHLDWDRDHHTKNARETRDRKSGQGKLI